MGRLRVRLILASCSGSKTMFSAFAEAEHNAVPVVRSTKVMADRDDEVVADGRRRSGVGYREYAAAVVSTIRNERRGLERDRQALRSRRSEVRGCEEDGGEDSCDAGTSVVMKGAGCRADVDSPTSRRRWRRRCLGGCTDVEDWSSNDPIMGDEGSDIDDDGLPRDIPTPASWRVSDRY